MKVKISKTALPWTIRCRFSKKPKMLHQLPWNHYYTKSESLEFKYDRLISCTEQSSYLFFLKKKTDYTLIITKTNKVSKKTNIHGCRKGRIFQRNPSFLPGLLLYLITFIKINSIIQGRWLQHNVRNSLHIPSDKFIFITNWHYGTYKLSCGMVPLVDYVPYVICYKKKAEPCYRIFIEISWDITSLLCQLYFLYSSWPLLLLICFLGRLFFHWQAFRTAIRRHKIENDCF